MNTTFHLFTIVAGGLYRGSGTGIIQLFLNAGPVVKFVMLILLVSSIVSWGIIFSKYKLLKKAEEQTEEFFDILEPKKDMALIFSESKRFSFSPVAAVFRAGYSEFLQQKKAIANRMESQGQVDNGHFERKDSIERSLRRATMTQVVRLERYLSFLATTGNTAPFIGLFGTVWGIMEAFQEIGAKGSSSLAIVAPGISEALVATAAGLFAAIPAVVAYNYYLSRVRRLVSEMDSFSSDFLNTVERTM
ncbi:MAG TPA: protein TolQ [Thermodesulfobacteriota bacterium]|nr:protein TolQ [Deltaproteobacteria bacterium]HNR13805.1 protein TolQ [Thermodesulfobacteriota bacterium]HNU72191.1 protein TolQ [Thermodesulfobacteriota bacterium]HOC39535.1 protein TolQ [Thermodesulfobacteriota bacterium]